MANAKSIATNPVNAKAEGLKLPPKSPAVAQAPVKPAAVPAKPAAVPAKPIVAVKKVEPIAAVKKAVRKPAAKDAKPRPKAQAASKPSKRPGTTAGGNDPIAEGWILAAKGAESLSREFIGLAKGSVQAQLALTEALIKARTPQEALTLQGDFARESLENMSQGFAKLAGMSMELTQNLMAPIQHRVR